MHVRAARLRLVVPSILAATVVALAVAVAGPAPAGFAGATAGSLNSVPASGTPALVSTGTTEQVRQLVQCGSTMYAVGTFTEIQSGSTTYTRGGAFSFSATPPYQVTGWDPEVNGTVNSITFDGSSCADAYLGGKFTAIGGTAARDIAEVDTSTGAVVSKFKASANGEVDTLAAWNGHILAGGTFTSINGSAADPYFSSLSPTTGRNDGYLDLSISGNYVYTDDNGSHSASNPTRVYNQQLSPDGTRDLIEGDFTTVGGAPRRQAAVIDLGSASASVDGWYATELNQNCAVSLPFYARGGAWSPDSSTIYIASTGYKPANGAGFQTWQPRAGLCDAAASFPSTPTQVTHTWINYAGCDSIYAAVSDGTTAYFAGHERWASNPNGCDNAGPGAVSTGGFVGLSSSDGSVTFNPTRSRGEGADDMLLTSGGLWIASDNADGATKCGGVSGHAGICLFPSVN